MFTAVLKLCVLVYCIVLPVDGNIEAFTSLHRIVPTLFYFQMASMTFLLVELVFYLVISLTGKYTMSLVTTIYAIQLISALFAISGPFAIDQDNFEQYHLGCFNDDPEDQPLLADEKALAE